MGKLKNQQATAWAQDAAHLGERLILVGHIAQAEGDSNDIKPLVRERQLFRVALCNRQHVAFVQKTVTATGQHGIVDVSEPDLPTFTDPFGKCERQITGATGDIEHS